MYCFKSSGDTTFGPRDEIYWSLASGADTHDHLSEKQVTSQIGGVSSGHNYAMPSGYTLFDGTIHNYVAAYIICWEADDSGQGWYNKLAQVCKEMSVKTSEFTLTGSNELDELIGQIPGVGTAIGYVEWAGFIAGLISKAMDVVRNDDDWVAEAYLVWNRSALERMHMNGSKPEFYADFNGGSMGKHNMTITRVARERVVTMKSRDSMSWTRFEESGVKGGISIAEKWSDLWFAIRSPDNKISIKKGGLNTTSTLQAIPGHTSPYRTSMAASSAGLHLTYRGSDNGLYMVYRPSASAAWANEGVQSRKILQVSQSPQVCVMRDTPIIIHYT
jgi:hypothetical protein